MSVTLMGEVWPLDLHQTDKSVLLALADSANDEDDGKTWIPIVSKQPRTRRGRLKLSLVVKTRLSETTIRECIKRLVAAGHITREEKPGLGCTYWVHPVPDETPAAPEGVREARASGDELTPAAPEGESPGSRGENQRTRNKQGAGAREAKSRQLRPPAGPSDGPATAAPKPKGPVEERAAEGDREELVRDRIIVDARAEPRWLADGALKVRVLANDDGPVGLEVFALFGDRERVERLQCALKRSASAALGVPVCWVRVNAGGPMRG